MAHWCRRCRPTGEEGHYEGGWGSYGVFGGRQGPRGTRESRGSALPTLPTPHRKLHAPLRGIRNREESKMIGEIAKMATALIVRYPYTPMGEGEA